MKILLTLIVLLEAIYEGLYDRGKTKPIIICKSLNLFIWSSKMIQAAFICLFFYFAYKVSGSGWHFNYIPFYILMRVALFNWVNTLAAGRKSLVGKTSLIDRIIPIITFGNIWFYILICTACLTVGIFVIKI